MIEICPGDSRRADNRLTKVRRAEHKQEAYLGGESRGPRHLEVSVGVSAAHANEAATREQGRFRPQRTLTACGAMVLANLLLAGAAPSLQAQTTCQTNADCLFLGTCNAICLNNSVFNFKGCFPAPHCDDNKDTTTNDCVFGICGNSPQTCEADKDCNDGNPATRDSCDKSQGAPFKCINQRIRGFCLRDEDCVKPCNIGMCTQHLCNFTPLPDGSSCSDGDACNGQETCLSGACIPGIALDCEDHVECTRDSCDHETGCKSDPADCKCNVDADCPSADLCDRVRCQEVHTCTSTPVNCPSTGNECTDDRCDPKTGSCMSNERHPPSSFERVLCWAQNSFCEDIPADINDCLKSVCRLIKTAADTKPRKMRRRAKTALRIASRLILRRGMDACSMELQDLRNRINDWLAREPPAVMKLKTGTQRWQRPADERVREHAGDQVR